MAMWSRLRSGVNAVTHHANVNITISRRTRSGWFLRDGDAEVYASVVDGLKTVYSSKLLPLEETYRFHDFHSPMLHDADFEAKPSILLMGQYSTGKTTLIKYLLESDFPGMRVGPEPTTDRFIAVMYGERESVIPGNALVVDTNRHFRPLSKFGNNFLNRFQCSTLRNAVLRSISVIDTPGILSGEKQRINRGYDFPGVLEWFAERVDRIVLLFDAHKLDVSDEFRRCIEALRKHDDKIRILLNKADMVNHQQLMRVYGALMWSLGKIMDTPETARVYIGSFWDEPLAFDVNRRLFEDEERDLLHDIHTLPRNAALRKLTDLSKRARLAKVHAYLVSEIRRRMPPFLGKQKAKFQIIDNLSAIYGHIQSAYQLPAGDFPDVQKMQELLAHYDFSKFRSLRQGLVDAVDAMLADDITRLMQMIPVTDDIPDEEPLIRGGVFKGIVDDSPFGYRKGEGIDEGSGEVTWVVNKYREKYDAVFEALNPVDGKVTRSDAKKEMMKSKLPSSVLGRIWMLSDVDRDGLLDADEFALAMHLIRIKLSGHDLPPSLPPHLVPPSKRDRTPEPASEG